jgi:hypothetical protein
MKAYETFILERPKGRCRRLVFFPSRWQKKKQFLKFRVL